MRYLLRESSIAPKGTRHPLVLFGTCSLKHTCASPSSATYRAIIARYPIETSARNVHNTIATKIMRYEKYLAKF